MEDFVELYRIPVHYVAGATIKRFGGVDSFDFVNHTLLLHVAHRLDYGGNPAKAFRYQGYSMIRNEDLYANSVFKESADASREFKEAGERTLRAQNSSFVGIFEVVFLESAFYRVYPVEVVGGLWSLVERGPPLGFCYDVLERTVESGTVWRMVDGVRKPGEMRLVKGKWRWFEDPSRPAICKCTMATRRVDF